MDAVLVIDKPAGMTSHDVVAHVRRLLGERLVGHLGTLDPLATGVLPLLIGRYTRLAQFYSAAGKIYEGVMRLGFATDTYDADGEPLVAAGGAGGGDGQQPGAAGGEESTTVPVMPDRVALSVTNRGSDIAAEHLPRLFDRFYRVAKGDGGGSTGLGLHIVKTIMEAQGGGVSVESALGRGTAFHLALQRAR